MGGRRALCRPRSPVIRTPAWPRGARDLLRRTAIAAALPDELPPRPATLRGRGFLLLRDQAQRVLYDKEAGRSRGGFSKKSIAPRRVARTAASIVAWRSSSRLRIVPPAEAARAD